MPNVGVRNRAQTKCTTLAPMPFTQRKLIGVTGKSSVEDLEKLLEQTVDLTDAVTSMKFAGFGGGQLARGAGIQSEATLKMRIRMKKKLEKKNKKK